MKSEVLEDSRINKIDITISYIMQVDLGQRNLINTSPTYDTFKFDYIIKV